MSVRLLPGLALVFNAFVWGTAWWPFRHLQGHGMHPLWATAIVFTLASLAIVAARPQSIRQVLTTPALWTLVAAAGVTNASFNWAVTIGDVVRVVLLFYLMPLWTVVLARLVLHERLTPAGWLRIVLGVAGAVVVLWPSAGSDGLPHGGGWLGPISLADALGVIGGFSFAFNNVMLRREARRPEEGRALAMFLGPALRRFGDICAQPLGKRTVVRRPRTELVAVGGDFTVDPRRAHIPQLSVGRKGLMPD